MSQVPSIRRILYRWSAHRSIYMVLAAGLALQLSLKEAYDFHICSKLDLVLMPRILQKIKCVYIAAINEMGNRKYQKYNCGF